MTDPKAAEFQREILRTSVRRFVGSECPPEAVHDWEQRQVYPRELFKKIADLGWIGVALPTEDGGAGGGALDMIVISEELGRSSTDLVASYTVTSSGLITLAKHASSELKAEVIPQVLAGEKRLSISVTEPDAGSDTAAMRTTAVKDGDDFLVNGQKTFCEGAGLPDTLIQLYAKTDTEAARHEGISMLLVEGDSPGVTSRRLPMLARNMIGVFEVFLDDARVPRSHLVGAANSGWDMLVADVIIQRMNVSAGFVGATSQVIEDLIVYVQNRVQFGRAIGSFQAVAHTIVDLYVRAEAARHLVRAAAERFDEGSPFEKEVSMAKLFASEIYHDATRNAMHLMGGYGYVTESQISRQFLEAAVAPTMAGPNQIQRNIIARGLGLKVK